MLLGVVIVVVVDGVWLSKLLFHFNAGHFLKGCRTILRELIDGRAGCGGGYTAVSAVFEVVFYVVECLENSL